jgi:uncharacterized protein YbjQ (UPF0145 family)
MAKDDAAQRAAAMHAASAVLVSTGDVQAKYRPLNIIFAVGGSAGGIFKAASPQLAFESARFQLQIAAVALGAHAVVHCAFGYSESSSVSFGCSTRTFTVTGYGTAVKFE